VTFSPANGDEERKVTDSDVAFYRENGYLVVNDLFDRATVEACLAEGTRICRGELGPLEGLEPTTPEESDEEVLGRYMTCPLVHKISPLLGSLMSDDRIADVLVRLIGDDVKGMQSQFFIKHAGAPGNALHQDENFLPTRDRSFLTVWIALDAATIQNGCLRFFAGSHAPGVLWPMRPHNDSSTYDREEECYGFPYAPDDAVPIELGPGSAVFFNGYLLHGSYPNRSERGFRRALLYSYSSAATPLAWNPRNVPVSNQSDYRDIVMVRGVDPYAWKGVKDLSRAWLRKVGPTVTDKIFARRDQVTGAIAEGDQNVVAEIIAASGG
jgi:ectoine hydroxylase-related dioxygenase (phytanoyl-CoA dioxygenase family)